MSLPRQCPRKSPGNFLGETKKAFRGELRSNCVLIGTLSRCRHAEWRWNGWSLDVALLVYQRVSIGVGVW